MNRREFLQTAGALALAAAAPVSPLRAADMPAVTARHLPRWRGFNLLQKFTKRRGGNPPFAESDFVLLNEWGFDFVRLPLSYLCWTDPGDWLKLREEELKHLDEAVAFGGKHGVHVNLNLHRAPGYCVNPPKEPLDLWKDDKALDACAFHWGQLAKRFQGTWGKAEVYLDVQNVTDRSNPEEIVYDYSYTKKAYITGLPTLPVAGARLEW